jgi:hypothetical protein
MELCCVVFYRYGGKRETGQFRENGTEVLDTCGHYTAAIKSPAGCSPKWRLYNDSYVSDIVGDMPDSGDAAAYMLVYHSRAKPKSSDGIPGDTARLPPATSLESDGGSESAVGPVGTLGTLDDDGALGGDGTLEGADHEEGEVPTFTLEQYISKGYSRLNSAWRGLVRQPPRAGDPYAPFLPFVLEKARDDGVIDADLEIHIRQAKEASPFNRMRAELDTLGSQSAHAASSAHDDEEGWTDDLAMLGGRSDGTDETPFLRLKARVESDSQNTAAEPRRMPGLVLSLLHGQDVLDLLHGQDHTASAELKSRLMSPDPRTGMARYISVVLEHLFPAWTEDQRRRYVRLGRCRGVHDLSDTLFSCTLSALLFDWLRTIFRVHFGVRYFTEIVEQYASLASLPPFLPSSFAIRLSL